MMGQAIRGVSGDRETTPPRTTDAETLAEWLRFGALMLRAGDTAFRVRRSMTTLAHGMGLDAWSVHFGLDSIAGNGRRGSGVTTLVRGVGAPGVNTERIVGLERLARTLPPTATAPELASKLAAIEREAPRHPVSQTAAAVGAACGAFAFLNGGAAPEVVASAVGGAVGQALRSQLLRRRFNQYAVALVCAIVASGVYCLIAVAGVHAGFAFARNDVGLISSVLFLVPGFALLTALLDVLQHETGVALTRLVYAMTLLLATALGLGVIVAVVGVTAPTSPPSPPEEPLRLALRALASFAGACGFAILFNSAWRNVLLVGVIAILGNAIRLTLHDAGLALPAATFFGALAVGLAASLVGRWCDTARVVLTIPGVIMMIPGLYAFETVVCLKQGEILAGIQAAVLVGFDLAAMAAGLAAARFASEPEWLRE